MEKITIKIMMLMFWVSCGGNSVDGNKVDAGNLVDAGPLPFSTLVADPDDDAAFLFEETELRTYELVLTQEDLLILDNDPVAEVYVNGTLRFQGEEFTGIGIRYKGSVGAYIGCVENGGLMPSGAKTCVKLSMKVKMDHSDAEGRFYGLKRLQFHSMNQDESLMRERLGYWLYRKMGVAAPRTAPVRLLINGEFAGLFLLVEQVDGRFTRARFSEGGKGNVYKEVWPIHDSEEIYKAALRSNRDENPSVQSMMQFNEALSTTPESMMSAVSDQFVERNYILRYLAVDRSIRHDDGIMHWYCNIPAGQGGNPGDCGNHNYYWYEEEKAEHFWLIAWDLDLILDGSAFTSLLSPWDEIPDSCEIIQLGFFGYLPPACDPLIRAWVNFKDEYSAIVDEFVRGPFSSESVTFQLYVLFFFLHLFDYF